MKMAYFKNICESAVFKIFAKTYSSRKLIPSGILEADTSITGMSQPL